MVEVILTELKGWIIDGKFYKHGETLKISKSLLEQFPNSFKETNKEKKKDVPDSK